jgi:hypothetical protein
MAKLERTYDTSYLKPHATTQAASANHVGLLAEAVPDIGAV